MQLIFSNCLSFFKGPKYRGIRHKALTLQSGFEMEIDKLYKENSSLKDSSLSEQWVQCDNCLKWRLIHVENEVPKRWCCEDLGDQYSCDLPEVGTSLNIHSRMVILPGSQHMTVILY